MGALLGGAGKADAPIRAWGRLAPHWSCYSDHGRVPSPHAGRHRCGAPVHRPTPSSYMNQRECKEYNPIKSFVGINRAAKKPSSDVLRTDVLSPSWPADRRHRRNWRHETPRRHPMDGLPAKLLRAHACLSDRQGPRRHGGLPSHQNWAPLPEQDRAGRGVGDAPGNASHHRG